MCVCVCVCMYVCIKLSSYFIYLLHLAHFYNEIKICFQRKNSCSSTGIDLRTLTLTSCLYHPIEKTVCTMAFCSTSCVELAGMRNNST